MSHPRPRRLVPALLAFVAASSLLVGAPSAALASPTALPAPVVESPTAEILDARTQLASLQEEAGRAAEEYNASVVLEEETQRLVVVAEFRSRAAESRLERSRGVLDSYAAATYRSGGVGMEEVQTLDTIMTSEDMNEGSRQASMLRVVGDRKSDAVESLALAEAEARDASAAAESAQRDAGAARSERLAAQESAQRKAEESAALLLALETEQSRKEREAREAAAARAAQAALLAAQAEQEAQAAAAAEARSAAATTSPFSFSSGATSRRPSSVTLPPAPGPTAAANKALATAFSHLGKPYRWGGSGPDSFDCSGLTSVSWAAAGVSIPRVSSAQYAALPHVSREDLQPGDLVFFGSPIYHVGMYVGDGKMIHAPSSGDVVKVAPLLSEYVGAARPG